MALTAKLSQVKMILEQSFTEDHYENTILHSDQGWHFYHRFLEDKGDSAVHVT
mgnify:FL=1